MEDKKAVTGQEGDATEPSILELARRCVESWNQAFDSMEAVLDQRLGAVVARLRSRDVSQVSQLSQSPNPLSVETQLPVASSSPTLRKEDL